MFFSSMTDASIGPLAFATEKGDEKIDAEEEFADCKGITGPGDEDCEELLLDLLCEPV